MKHYIDYKKFVDEALRKAVKKVLNNVQKNGIRGNHQLYISFLTNHPKVEITEQLKKKFPHEITIVLQHQYWDLNVYEDHFEVTLSFDDKPEDISVNFSALTGFADPSSNFGLQFESVSELVKPNSENVSVKNKNNKKNKGKIKNTEEKILPESQSENVIALNKFRKK